MRLKEPFIITPRLAPGLEIGDGWLSIEYSDLPGDEGRTRYRWFLYLKDGREFSGEDLQSGCQGGNLTEGMESLLFSLSAFAEAQRYPESENRDLFPEGMVEWAQANESEISMLSCELDDSGDLIEE